MSKSIDVRDSNAEMRAAVTEKAREASRAFSEMLKSGECSSDNLLAMQFALAAMRRAAESPETLATFCRAQGLGIDAAVPREHGFDLDAPAATRAQSEAAKKAQKEVRKLLDAILSREGLLEETKREATLRDEFERAGTPGMERVASIHDETVSRIEQLNLSPEVQASFVGRAMEARRKSEEALAAIERPDARLAKSLEGLADRMQALNEAILLTAHSKAEFSGVPVGALDVLSTSPLSKLVENPMFRDLEESVMRDIRPHIESTLKSMDTADRVLAATAALGLTTYLVAMPIMMANGHPASVELLGLYMSANLAVAAASGWTIAGGNFLRKTFSSIRSEVGRYGDALAGVTNKPAAEIQKLPDAALASEADDAKKRGMLHAAAAGQRTL